MKEITSRELTATALALLTKSEQAALVEQERVIDKGMNEFVRVGNALTVIRDSKLYRGEYKTFEEYCRTRWGFSKSSANRYVAAAEVSTNLMIASPAFYPRIESHVRPLVALKPGEQRRIWQEVVEAIKETDRPLTANLISWKIKEAFPTHHSKVVRNPRETRGRKKVLHKKELLEMVEARFLADAESLKDATPKQMIEWFESVIGSI